MKQLGGKKVKGSLGPMVFIGSFFLILRYETT